MNAGGASLDGRRAFVTGGAVGIGAGICAALAKAGADVAFTYHTHPPDETTKRVESAGTAPHPLRVDVTDPAGIDDAVKRAVDALGGHLDVVVNNAGGLVGRVAVADMSNEHWQRVLDVNLSSAFYSSRAAMPVLSDRQGRIINISSLAAFDGGGPGGAAYSVAKAGIVSLTRGLAKELGPRGITVNAVAPGLILQTPFHDTFSTDEMKQAGIDRTPLARAGSVEDVAATVAYLASDAASFITGEVIHVNGGMFFA